MKFFKSLNASLKIAILTYFVSFFGFLILLFLLFNGHQDIPLGVILAGGVIGTINLIAGLIEHFTANKEGAIISVVFVALRMFIIIGVMILIALMYYRWNMPYFNVIAFVVVYSVSIIITIIVHLKERKA